MSEVAQIGLEHFAFNSKSTYRVVKEIARGGMGIIFLAEKNTGGVLDEVVLKCLRIVNIEEEEKLKQEANIATMLRHENIVKTYGLEMVRMSKLPEEFCQLIQQENTPPEEEKPSFLQRITGGIKTKKSISEKMMMMMVMDYIKGTDLYTLMMRHIRNNLLIPIPLAAFIICRVACALSYAHTYIVHRDISPENVLISEQGVCKLTDFGIAVVAHQQPDYWAGKLMYMAPEQIRNDKIDERADIFALGLVAYQIITGIPLVYASPSLEFEKQVEIVCQQLQNDIIPPHQVRNDIPLELSRIIYKMLSLAPEYRYHRAAAVANDLEKNYLYAKGFGPTNNSLASYINIFNSNFEDYDEEELQQLSFLKDQQGNIALRRTLDFKDFTRTGHHLLAERRGSAIVVQLRKMYHEQKEQESVAKVAVPSKFPVIKAKYLDNVIECFALTPEQEITIGRNSKNIIVLPETIVSGQHARIYIRNDEPIIEDQSSNGTLVNGERITRIKLQEGDKIQVGSTLLYFIWEKRPGTPEKILSLTEPVPDKLADIKDLVVQFFPSEENLLKIEGIAEQFLVATNIGTMKRNVMAPAIYEAVRIFVGSSSEFATQVRMIRGKKYISFRCTSPEKSTGYEFFLTAVHRRSGNDKLTSKNSLEPQELAISLILKVFERIEIMRFSREIYLTNFI